MPRDASAQFGFLPRVINGSIAGLVGVTCVFPIDLVKTRLQNQQVIPGRKPMYSSMFDCGVKTFKKEGFFGMYRGSGVNLLLITPEKVIKLVGNDFFRHLLRTDKGKLSLGRECLAGAGAGLFQIVVTTPMELLKIQLQDSGRTATEAPAKTAGSNLQSSKIAAEKNARPSATKIALDLFRERGIVGLYRGFGSTMLRDVTFSAIYFPLFSHLNGLGKRRGDSQQAVFYISFIAGCGAGATASFCVTPMDVIKTRLQTLTKGTGERQYSGVLDCFTQTLKHEGWQAFFKGGACRMMVVAPLFGIAQTVYFMGVAEKILGYQKSLPIS